MADKVWTAAEFDAMTPSERRKILDASIVTDLGSVPAEFLDRVRARTHQRIAAVEATPDP